MPLRNPEHAYAEYRAELAPGERFTQYHIKVRAADVARYVLLPGSHVRGRLIAEQLEEAQVVGRTRGYHVYTGTYAGARVSVCSTGMGGPAVAIAMEELGALGADTFIRVGSAGGWQPEMRIGDVVVATATARYGGTSHWYLPVEFPAVADHTVVAALLAAARRLEVPVRHGICATRDALYVPWDPTLRTRLEAAGVLASEMESDTLFVVGSSHGYRCGAAFVLASASLALTGPGGELFEQGERRLIEVCLEAVVDLAQIDRTAHPVEGGSPD
jgi:uridine phosphorylase